MEDDVIECSKTSETEPGVYFLSFIIAVLI